MAANTLKKTRTKRKVNPKNKNQNDVTKPLLLKFLPVIFIASLLSLISFPFKTYGIKTLISYYSIGNNPDEFATNKIYESINLYHDVKENINKKKVFLGNLGETVHWFSKKRSKEELQYSSEYDEFYFSTKPKYDFLDDCSQDYQIRFNGFHRYRSQQEDLIKGERYYCEIASGKIITLKPIESNQLESNHLDLINSLNNPTIFAVFSLIFWFIIVSLLLFIAILPVHVTEFLGDLISKGVGI